MAASVAHLATTPNDCSGADDNPARPCTLSTVGGYAIYLVARHEERHYGHLPQTSGNSGAMLASSEGPDANLLIRQKQHHKRAFDLISKALKYDVENDNFKELAIDLYRKGIKKLQKGITIDCSQGKGLSWERAQSLSDKMKVNLDMAKERLDFLESIVKMKHFGDDLPWHTGVARPQANQKREAWQKAAPATAQPRS
ncbi:hypothetical protein MRX96_044133 [Rhipicephalus microplus]